MTDKLAVIVTGSRHYTEWRDIEVVLGAIRPDVLIHGNAAGADKLADSWAHINGVKVEAFPADWRRLGKRAGHERNQRMLDRLLELRAKGYRVLCVAFPLPGSRGTYDMANRSSGAGVETLVFDWRTKELNSYKPGEA